MRSKDGGQSQQGSAASLLLAHENWVGLAWRKATAKCADSKVLGATHCDQTAYDSGKRQARHLLGGSQAQLANMRTHDLAGDAIVIA